MIKKILISQPEPSSEKSPYYDIANDFGVELVSAPSSRLKDSAQKSSANRKSDFWISPLWYLHRVLL